MFSSKVALCGLVAPVLLVLAPELARAQYYVDPEGNDSQRSREKLWKGAETRPPVHRFLLLTWW